VNQDIDRQVIEKFTWILATGSGRLRNFNGQEFVRINLDSRPFVRHNVEVEGLLRFRPFYAIVLGSGPIHYSRQLP